MTGAIFVLGILIGAFLGFALATVGSVQILREKGYSSYEQIPSVWDILKSNDKKRK